MQKCNDKITESALFRNQRIKRQCQLAVQLADHGPLRDDLPLHGFQLTAHGFDGDAKGFRISHRSIATAAPFVVGAENVDVVLDGGDVHGLRRLRVRMRVMMLLTAWIFRALASALARRA